MTRDSISRDRVLSLLINLSTSMTNRVQIRRTHRRLYTNTVVLLL